jgi:hypothetical protein
LFDLNLAQLYELYFKDEDKARLEKIQIFTDISALVKIVEQKFLVAQMLIDKREFMENERGTIDGFREMWHEFKVHNFADSAFNFENLADK